MNNNQINWLEIDQSAIYHNLQQIRQIIGPKVKLMAIIKSNAYGHGMFNMASLCESSKLVNYFGVVNLQEALLLRKTGIKLPILVLSYFDIDYIHLAIKNDIDLPVYDFFMAELIDETAKNINAVARIQLKIDVGTSRLGILTKDALEFVKKTKRLKHVEIIGVFAHLADSENYSQAFTNKQITEFFKLKNKIVKEKIKIPLYHIACSAATIINKKSHFNLVRMGIALYGLWPSDENRKLAKKAHPNFILKPALTWKTKIIQIKEVPSQSYIGYSCTVKVKRKTKIAIIPVGYNEGYSRGFSNNATVLIKGQHCRVIGRICMNLMIVDVTSIKNVNYEEEVILLGKQGQHQITADDLAQKTKTINYEIVTRINPLIPRKYI